MKKKLLVVDDDKSVRESVKKVLQGEDYEVFLAADGQEAVERYDPKQIDLLLLDVNLPIRNGWDTFEQFTSRNPLLPVVIITGHPDQYLIAIAAGASAFVEKPLDAPLLLQTISDTLAEPYENRLRRMAGRGGKVRYVPPDLNQLLESLRARWSLPLRYKTSEENSHH